MFSQVARKSHRGVQPAGSSGAAGGGPVQLQFGGASTQTAISPQDMISHMFIAMMRNSGMFQQQPSQQQPSHTSMLNMSLVPSNVGTQGTYRPAIMDGTGAVDPSLAGVVLAPTDDADERPGSGDEELGGGADDDALELMEAAAGIKKRPAAKCTTAATGATTAKGKAKAKAKAKGKATAKGAKHAKTKAKAKSTATATGASCMSTDPVYKKAYYAKYKASVALGYDHLKATDHAQRAGQRARNAHK